MNIEKGGIMGSFNETQIFAAIESATTSRKVRVTFKPGTKGAEVRKFRAFRDAFMTSDEDDERLTVSSFGPLTIEVTVPKPTEDAPLNRIAMDLNDMLGPWMKSIEPVI